VAPEAASHSSVTHGETSVAPFEGETRWTFAICADADAVTKRISANSKGAKGGSAAGNLLYPGFIQLNEFLKYHAHLNKNSGVAIPI
jgi:hypothetical protein